jgi:glutathione S-transferase
LSGQLTLLAKPTSRPLTEVVKPISFREYCSMNIYTSPTSPFARKVRIFAQVTQEPQINWVLTKPLESPQLREINPLGKIPALESDAIILFDSTLICEYLDELFRARGGNSLFHKGLPDYFAVQKNHYLANGVMDAAVAYVMDKRRPDASSSQFWLSRWSESIRSGLHAMNVEYLGTADKISVAGIATASALGYLQLRLPETLADLSGPLNDWHQAVAQADWYSKTLPMDT